LVKIKLVKAEIIKIKITEKTKNNNPFFYKYNPRLIEKLLLTSEIILKIFNILRPSKDRID
jgi:hypothetical protein